jgi:crossover junction endodeoxyribonuclease RuvC
VTATLLSLDLATRFGWALGVPGAQPTDIQHGSVQLPAREGEGAVFWTYENWLMDALARWQPRLVVYEAPFLDRNRTSIQVATRLIGLGVITTKCCHEAGVYRVENVENTMIKKFMTGRGRAEKLDIISAVRRFGFDPVDDNDADAVAIFLWAEARHAPHITRGAGPLFAA